MIEINPSPLSTPTFTTRECREQILEIPSDMLDESGQLLANSSLFDISRIRLGMICDLLEKPAPVLTRDKRDDGVTTSCMHEILRAVRPEELKELKPARHMLAQKILEYWADELSVKLAALKKAEGCACIGRHKNSKEIERHLSAIRNDLKDHGISAFLWAAANADVDGLKEWITGGMNVNQTDAVGRSALILVLQKNAEQEGAREKIDSCAHYLLSVPDIDPYRISESGNAYGVALQNGHDSIAAFLIRTYPCTRYNNGLGFRTMNVAAQHCPRVLAHLKKKMLKAGGDDLAYQYRKELPLVPANERAWSRAVYLEVMDRFMKNDPAEGGKAMQGMLKAAAGASDMEMLDALERYR
jgi:hypothetical protein